MPGQMYPLAAPDGSPVGAGYGRIDVDADGDHVVFSWIEVLLLGLGPGGRLKHADDS